MKIFQKWFGNSVLYVGNMLNAVIVCALVYDDAQGKHIPVYEG